MNDYRDRLQTLMDGIGMDRTRLSIALGISYQAVRKVFENNAKFGTVNNMKTAQYFHVSSDWLLTGKGVQEVDHPKNLTAGAIEIAELYDLIPVSDRIRRAQAASGATAAILDVLERHAIVLQAKDQKKQSV